VGSGDCVGQGDAVGAVGCGEDVGRSVGDIGDGINTVGSGEKVGAVGPAEIDGCGVEGEVSPLFPFPSSPWFPAALPSSSMPLLLLPFPLVSSSRTLSSSPASMLPL
jgi:hypothetical protein